MGGGSLHAVVFGEAVVVCFNSVLQGEWQRPVPPVSSLSGRKVGKENDDIEINLDACSPFGALLQVASTGIRTSSEAEDPARSHSAPRGDMMATTSDLPRGESLSGIVVALGVAYVFQLYNA